MSTVADPAHAALLMRPDDPTPPVRFPDCVWSLYPRPLAGDLRAANLPPAVVKGGAR